jgi:heme exporter protein D
MYFDSLQALLTMDGHGGYVWAAYLIAAAVILGILVTPIRRRKRILMQLAGELKRSQGSPISVEEGS